MDEQVLELSLPIYKPGDMNSNFLRFLPSPVIYDYIYIYIFVISSVLPELLRVGPSGPIGLL